MRHRRRWYQKRSALTAWGVQ